ncbi:hypothetical protein HDU96_002198 [Phlyctochytrium bullatum]|nr:hypothetical protein HDU96_002198 [Phlyctochytrium bullatum]
MSAIEATQTPADSRDLLQAAASVEKEDQDAKDIVTGTVSRFQEKQSLVRGGLKKQASQTTTVTSNSPIISEETYRAVKSLIQYFESVAKETKPPAPIQLDHIDRKKVTKAKLIDAAETSGAVAEEVLKVAYSAEIDQGVADVKKNIKPVQDVEETASESVSTYVKLVLKIFQTFATTEVAREEQEPQGHDTKSTNSDDHIAREDCASSPQEISSSQKFGETEGGILVVDFEESRSVSESIIRVEDITTDATIMPTHVEDITGDAPDTVDASIYSFTENVVEDSSSADETVAPVSVSFRWSSYLLKSLNSSKDEVNSGEPSAESASMPTRDEAVVLEDEEEAKFASVEKMVDSVEEIGDKASSSILDLTQGASLIMKVAKSTGAKFEVTSASVPTFSRTPLKFFQKSESSLSTAAEDAPQEPEATRERATSAPRDIIAAHGLIREVDFVHDHETELCDTENHEAPNLQSSKCISSDSVVVDDSITGAACDVEAVEVAPAHDQIECYVYTPDGTIRTELIENSEPVSAAPQPAVSATSTNTPEQGRRQRRNPFRSFNNKVKDIFRKMFSCMTSTA